MACDFLNSSEMALYQTENGQRKLDIWAREHRMYLLLLDIFSLGANYKPQAEEAQVLLF